MKELQLGSNIPGGIGSRKARKAENQENVTHSVLSEASHGIGSGAQESIKFCSGAILDGLLLPSHLASLVASAPLYAQRRICTRDS